MCPLVPGIKCLIPRFIATVAVAAVALALLPSPAAADHNTKAEKRAGQVCGYSQDYDEQGGNKYLMKYRNDGTQQNPKWVCADNTDGSGGTARPLTGTTTSASTIAGIYGAHGSRTGAALTSWCVNTMFQNAARVPYDGTTTYANPEGTEDNAVGGINIKTGGSVQNPTFTFTAFNSDARVLDFDDLYNGARLCGSGKL